MSRTHHAAELADVAASLSDGQYALLLDFARSLARVTAANRALRGTDDRLLRLRLLERPTEPELTS